MPSQSRQASCLDGCCRVLWTCCRMLCCLGGVERYALWTTSHHHPQAYHHHTLPRTLHRPTTDALDTNPTVGLLHHQAPSPATIPNTHAEPDTPSSTTQTERARLLPKGHTPSDTGDRPAGIPADVPARDHAHTTMSSKPAKEDSREGSVGAAHPDKELLSGLEAQRARVHEKLGAGLSLEELDEDVCPTCLDPYTPGLRVGVEGLKGGCCGCCGMSRWRWDEGCLGAGTVTQIHDTSHVHVAHSLTENPRIVTTCQHHFHLACIYEWMERSQTCPMCGKSMHFNEIM